MGERILLVDDDQLLTEAVRFSLGRAGYTVCDVGSGQAALGEARKARFDLALLDIGLNILFC